jgi:FixJ family two-component response regulator
MDIISPSVFVIDDDAGVRRSLERLLRSAGWAVETFPSAREFLTRPAYCGTGCVVLDVQMPGMTGPDLQDHMAGRGIFLPIVYLTGHGDVRTSVRAMKNGAIDFLVKPADDEVLLKTIRQAMERHAVQRTRDLERQQREARLSRLSTREREVMECVIGGRLNKQIAGDLGISEQTVKAHRGRVMEKLEARSVAELVRLCDAVGIQPRQLSAALRVR